MTKGCHNCEFSGNKYDDYHSSPCASCRTKDSPPLLGGIPMEDISYMEDYSGIHPAYELEEKAQEKLLSALGKCVFELVDLKEKHPETYKYAMEKIRNPSLSYSEIARIYKCKKQNVLYHLKKAARVCEYLKYALLIDKRFYPKQ
jgi:hypothetical protein